MLRGELNIKKLDTTWKVSVFPRVRTEYRDIRSISIIIIIIIIIYLFIYLTLTKS